MEILCEKIDVISHIVNLILNWWHHAIRRLVIKCVISFTAHPHYNDVIMETMASQITSLTIVYLTSEFPAQLASNAENVSIWWRHHALNQESGSMNQFSFVRFVRFLRLVWVLFTYWISRSYLTNGKYKCGSTDVSGTLTKLDSNPT